MKIVVIGSGNIGQSIVESVCREGHDITVIDNNPVLVNRMVESFDVMGITGNGASLEVQLEANVKEADLVVAVTFSDEVNVLSCLLAHNLGAKDTIARVRNPEYVAYTQHLREELGLSMTINPEFETAKIIARNLTLPSALKVETFAKGKIELVELKIKEKSVLDNISLFELSNKYHFKVLVCAVLRNGEPIIPVGNFVLKANDKIYVTASHEDIIKLCNIAFDKVEKMKSILIVGGSRIAYFLCGLIEKENHKIKIIDTNAKVCNDLAMNLKNVDIICDDGSSQSVLEDEGIERTDALLALTGSDEKNMIISLYAQKMNVKKVVSKINNHSLHGIFESVGMASVVSPKEIIANQIISYIRAKDNKRGNNVVTLYRLVEQKVEALEFIINSSCNLMNVPLKNLKLKPNMLIGGILRDNEVIIPSGNDIFKLDDHVIVITTDSFIEDFNEIVD